jgi:hypothetical protein
MRHFSDAARAPIAWLPNPLRPRLYRWRGRVLDLEPVIDAVGAIKRSKSLRDDAFAAERARMAEDDRAVASEMLIVDDAVFDLSKEVGERRLALFKRVPAEVLAV